MAKKISPVVANAIFSDLNKNFITFTNVTPDGKYIAGSNSDGSGYHKWGTGTGDSIPGQPWKQPFSTGTPPYTPYGSGTWPGMGTGVTFDITQYLVQIVELQKQLDQALELLKQTQEEAFIEKTLTEDERHEDSELRKYYANEMREALEKFPDPEAIKKLKQLIKELVAAST